MVRGPEDGYSESIEYLRALPEMASGLDEGVDLFVLPAFPVLADAQRLRRSMRAQPDAAGVGFDREVE
jgi:hypothetical protein